jgi:hypothetical protein
VYCSIISGRIRAALPDPEMTKSSIDDTIDPRLSKKWRITDDHTF